jgi:hypothetical protein
VERILHMRHLVALISGICLLLVGAALGVCSDKVNRLAIADRLIFALG